MNEEALQRAIVELIAEISNLPVGPQTPLGSLSAEEVDRLKPRLNEGEGSGSLHESIDFLRLNIKYLLFDLEATRRENGCLRRMLEECDD